MRFGVHLRPTDETIDVRDLAPEVESAGFDSLWVSEHSHLPVRTRSRWPGGDEMPRFMSRFLDPFLTLARVATVTDRIGLGTGVCLLAQRDTIQTAKEVATLDVDSAGRVLLGVGAGWNREEMENHGVDFDDRFGRLREQVMALSTIWTQEHAEFHGVHVDFDPIEMWPKPVQRPRVPILIGGEGPTVLDRVVGYGDGWVPNDHPMLLERVVELDRRCAAADRPNVPVTAFAVDPDHDRVDALERGGVERCVFNLPAGDAPTVLDELGSLATFLH